MLTNFFYFYLFPENDQTLELLVTVRIILYDIRATYSMYKELLNN